MGKQEKVIVVVCCRDQYDGMEEMVGVVYDTEALRELVKECKRTYPDGFLIITATEYTVGVTFPDAYENREKAAAKELYTYRRDHNLDTTVKNF